MSNFRLTRVPVSIAAGESLSSSVDCTIGDVVAVLLPPDWTGTRLTVQMSIDNVDFYNVFDYAARELAISVIVGIGSSVVLNRDILTACNYLKFRAGSYQNPEPRSEQRNFFIVLASGTV